MEPTSLTLIAEATLRIILGWRFLISGLSNIRRWPNPVTTASILFPRGVFFRLGCDCTHGGGRSRSSNRVSDLDLFAHADHLSHPNIQPPFPLAEKVLPTLVPVVKSAISDEKAQDYFRTFDRQSFHAHEVGLRDNLVFLAAAVYFMVRGSGAYGLDSLVSEWVILVLF